MGYLLLVDEESMNSLRECYDWSSLENGVLVDVGGGAGHVSIFLAKVPSATDNALAFSLLTCLAFP